MGNDGKIGVGKVVWALGYGLCGGGHIWKWCTGWFQA